MVHASPFRFVWALALFVAPSFAAEVPAPLAHLVMGDRSGEVDAFTVGGRSLYCLRTFGPWPSLIWPEEGDPAPFTRDQGSITRWLLLAGHSLGHGPFRPAYLGESEWSTDIQVFRFRLERDGVPLWDAEVSVLFKDRQWIGIVNHLPGAISGPAIAPPDAPADRVFLARPLGDGRCAVDLVRLVRRPRGLFDEITFQPLPGVISLGNPALSSTWMQLPLGASIPVQGGNFTEWPLPVGSSSFPDQIDTDAQGVVWLSQPNQNLITRFDPSLETFTQFPVSAGIGPDGLIVDSGGIVWTGLITSSHLGRFDPQTQQHQAFQPPSSATMAIPTETSLGTIVISDHEGGILEWDPVNQVWLRDVTVPTPNPHLVAGVEDDAGVMWFTEFNAGQLARFDLASGVATEISVPSGGGPAFPAYSGGKIYFTLWSLARLGAYDIASGTFTFWDYAPSIEVGGPIFTAPGGDVVFGTRGDGTIGVYRPQLDSLQFYDIPTFHPGLKDGLTVDAQGTVWFTETGKDRLGRLEYAH